MGLCDAFFAESDCCLDDWWPAPFRAGLTGPSDLLSPPVQDLLRSLGARLPSTSMSVEGLLAQMKAAAPSSRHAPAMERQVHAGLLAQVMQHHLDVGGADSRGDGLTMQQLAAARQLDRQPPRRWSRPDNVHRNTARPPPGARQSCASQGSALGTQAAPRAKPGSALGTQAAPSAKPGSALGTQAAPRGGAAKGTAAPPGQWQAHMAGQGWPVSEAVVDAFLEDLRGAAAGGIARYMQSERERRHGALYIADIGDIPELKDIWPPVALLRDRPLDICEDGHTIQTIAPFVSPPIAA